MCTCFYDTSAFAITGTFYFTADSEQKNRKSRKTLEQEAVLHKQSLVAVDTSGPCNADPATCSKCSER